MSAITRNSLCESLRAALEPLDYVNAMWRAGSDSFGRDDEWSDLDVVLDVADGRQSDAFEVVEATLEHSSPIARRMVMPEPTWHGHSQRLYQLRDAPEHLMIDLVIMQRNVDAPRFDERERHGEPVVVFDKLGIVRSVALDWAPHRERMRAHLEPIRERLVMLRHLIDKEVRRGNALDALSRYQHIALAALVAGLRARHAPARFDFGWRYLSLDLPAQVYASLRRLCFVADLDDLAAKLPEALAWAERELDAALAALDRAPDAAPDATPQPA
jgi:hypothetical protein